MIFHYSNYGDWNFSWQLQLRHTNDLSSSQHTSKLQRWPLVTNQSNYHIICILCNKITYFSRMSVSSDNVKGAIVMAIKHWAAKERKHDNLVLLCAGSSQFGSWCTYFHAITTYRMTASQHWKEISVFNCSMRIRCKQHIANTNIW